MKSLFIHSNGMKCIIEDLSCETTLADVRLRIREEFDDDMLPAGISENGEDDFFFLCDGVRLSRKQENRKRAWDCIDSGLQLMTRLESSKRICTTQQGALSDLVAITPLLSRTLVQKEDASITSHLNENAAIVSKLDHNYLKDDSATIHSEAQPLPEDQANDSLTDNFSENLTENAVTTGNDDQNVKAPSQPADQDTDFVTESLPGNHGEDATSVSTDFSTKTHQDDDQSDSSSVLALDDPSLEGNQNEIAAPTNLHAKGEEAVSKSSKVIHDLLALLKENPDFCSSARHAEYQQDMERLMSQCLDLPQTTIGVLGNTGVGKSSLLNALLDEASVLPTSGSRGCTAAVVELRINPLLNNNESSSSVPVYCGKVEFMKLEDWGKELTVLVDECCTHDSKTVYARPPMADTQPDAAAAWSKLNQVYGDGTMENFHGKDKNVVFNKLWNNAQVRKLLTPPSGLEYNTVMVEVGTVDSGSPLAKEFLLPFIKQSRKAQRIKKRFATEFRNKINSYVYRKGSGKEPQTWPLIRVVKLTGPWPVLESGACLVDLPGVRDANAARAKVSQDYLQHCHQLWIVAPIQRAVDDGTAKDLMGEQFKRRLLMDGKYGKLAFVCTQTDDCEATEILRDHADVAQQVPGRWEQLLELQEAIRDIEALLHELEQEKEDFASEYDDAKKKLQQGEKALKNLQKRKNSSEVEVGSNNRLKRLEEKVSMLTKDLRECQNNLDQWHKSNDAKVDDTKQQLWREQKKLKSLCAQVRNEYSTTCLQDDFKAGLKDLYRKEDDDEGIAIDRLGIGDQDAAALPDDFQLPVYCISSNDYLKLQGIKPSNDGPPNTFLDGDDTNIPKLREFVHETTAEFRLSFAKKIVENSSDLMERVKLLATEIGDGSPVCAKPLERAFEQQVKLSFMDKLEPIVQVFMNSVREKVERDLKPSVKKGADKGASAAMFIVNSWGDKNRRTRTERRPDQNGLYWSTYWATVRREGVFTSPTYGEIDFNQELCDPMEKEFTTDWQSTMDTTIAFALSKVERDIVGLCTTTNQGILDAFSKEGLTMARLHTVSAAAIRGCLASIREKLCVIRSTATERQRELNRSLLPVVKQSMVQSYDAACNVTTGHGRFQRMKQAMSITTQRQVSHIFNYSTIILVKGIEALLLQLGHLIRSIALPVRDQLYNVYSICWDGMKQNLVADPVQLQKTHECRVRLLPSLNALCEHQREARAILGLRREEPEMELMEVETVDQAIQRRFAEAEQAGTVINFADDNDENSDNIGSLLSKKVNLGPASLNSGLETAKSSYDLKFPDAASMDIINKIQSSSAPVSNMAMFQVKSEPKFPAVPIAPFPLWNASGSHNRISVSNGADSDNDEEFQELLACKVDFTSHNAK